MDAEVLRLRAHIDQTRSELRSIVQKFDADELACLIKVCAAGHVGEFDERSGLLVGMLAVTAIFDLLESAP